MGLFESVTALLYWQRTRTAVPQTTPRPTGIGQNTPTGITPKHKHTTTLDVDSQAYFYLEGDNWQVSVSLPISLKAKIGDYVTIGMDSDKPYTQFEEHRTSYPPGQMKKRY
jgi:hypothetical protein